MAFPLRGGLVESCHTAAENTHPAFGLFTGQENKPKSHQSYSLPHFCQHLNSTSVMVRLHFSSKKEEKGKKIHCEEKLETMCSTNYWLGAAIAIATLSTEFRLRERGPC